MFGVSKNYFMTHRGQSNFGDDLYYDIFSRAALKNGLELNWLFTYDTNLFRFFFRYLFILIDGMKLILFAKSLTIIGGSISLLGSHKLLKAILIAKKISRFRFYGYSISFVNFINFEYLYIQLINKFDILFVRDYSIYNFIYQNKKTNHSDLKCYYTPDLAIISSDLFYQEDASNINYEGLLIGISLCYYNLYTKIDSFELESIRIDEIIKIISNSLDKNSNIVIFVLNSDNKIGDYKISDRLFTQLSNYGFTKLEILVYRSDNDAVIKRMLKLDRMISMRLHGFLVPYSLGVPSLLIEYSHKSRDIYFSINNNTNTEGILLIGDTYNEASIKLKKLITKPVINGHEINKIKIQVNDSLEKLFSELDYED